LVRLPKCDAGQGCCFLIVALAASGEVAFHCALGRAPTKLVLRNLVLRGHRRVLSRCLLSGEGEAPEKNQGDCRHHTGCGATLKDSCCSFPMSILFCCCFHCMPPVRGMVGVSPAPSRAETTIAKEKLRLQEYVHNMYIKDVDMLSLESVGCNETDFLREGVS
jgi:hypothetical protein